MRILDFLNKKIGRIHYNYRLNRNGVEENFYKINKIDSPYLKKNYLITDENISFSNPVDYATELARRIAANIGINIRQVVIGFSGSLSSAAIVQREGIDYFIEIDNWFMEHKMSIAACLSHEFSHVFLKDNNLEIYNDTENNEKYTDLMAICLGMGALLLNGLNPCEKYEKEGENTIKKEKGIKTYLSYDELGYSMALYAHAKGISRESVEELLSVNARNCFNNGFSAYLSRKNELLKKIELETGFILCPFCFQKIRIKINQGEKNILCSNCNNSFIFNTDFTL
jgi:hypothetical protein